MADDVQANIGLNIDTSKALTGLKALQSELSALHTQLSKLGPTQRAQAAGVQRSLIDNINATGKFAASMTTVKTTAESFTHALEKNKLTMGEYFRYAGGASKSFGKNFTREFATIEKVAVERVKSLQTQYIKLGRDANGAMRSIAVRPLTLDMNNLQTKTAIAAQKQQLLNQLLKQGSTQMLNWGKNTQWAGRQLMVGFTIPLGIFAGKAMQAFSDMEKQIISFKRVYGDLSTSAKDTDAMAESIRKLAGEFTKYGIAVSDTMEMASKAAAMGKTGADLLGQVQQASKLAVLGQVEQQQALQTTISLTDTFGTAAEDLGKKINFLNSVENQTSLSIEDLTVAIPKAGPVIKQLGGDVEDLAFFLTAMREGGINASEGANALKSGLAAMINPTAKAQKMLQGFGINLNAIVNKNKGDVRGTVVEFAKALDKLDPLNRAKAIEQLFGKFQFARISTLMKNAASDSSQAATTAQLAQKSSIELAAMAAKEMRKISSSPLYKFQKALQDFQTQMAPIGEAFMKFVTPIIDFVNGLLKSFNSLSDGTKTFVVGFTSIVAGLGPILLMTFGLIANGFANLIKGFTAIKNIFNRVQTSSEILGQETRYMTEEQIKAKAVAASLDQVHGKLVQTFNVESGAVNKLASAYERAVVASQKLMPMPMKSRANTKAPKKFASGGILNGPGTGTSDSIPAMLSNGEAVIPAKHVSQNRSLVENLISGRINKFARGYIPPYKSTYKSEAQLRYEAESKARTEANPEYQRRMAARKAKYKDELPQAFLYDERLAGKLTKDSPVAKRMITDQMIGKVFFSTWQDPVSFSVSRQLRDLRSMGLSMARYSTVKPNQTYALGKNYKINAYGPMGNIAKQWKDGGINDDGKPAKKKRDRSVQTVKGNIAAFGNKNRQKPSSWARLLEKSGPITWSGKDAEVNAGLKAAEAEMRSSGNFSERKIVANLKNLSKGGGIDLSHLNPKTNTVNMGPGVNLQQKQWNTSGVRPDLGIVNQYLHNLTQRKDYFNSLDISSLAKESGLSKEIVSAEVKKLNKGYHPTTRNSYKVLGAIGKTDTRASSRYQGRAVDAALRSSNYRQGYLKDVSAGKLALPKIMGKSAKELDALAKKDADTLLKRHQLNHAMLTGEKQSLENSKITAANKATTESSIQKENEKQVIAKKETSKSEDSIAKTAKQRAAQALTEAKQARKNGEKLDRTQQKILKEYDTQRSLAAQRSAQTRAANRSAQTRQSYLVSGVDQYIIDGGNGRKIGKRGKAKTTRPTKGAGLLSKITPFMGFGKEAQNARASKVGSFIGGGKGFGIGSALSIGGSIVGGAVGGSTGDAISQTSGVVGMGAMMLDFFPKIATVLARFIPHIAIATAAFAALSFVVEKSTEKERKRIEALKNNAEASGVSSTTIKSLTDFFGTTPTSESYFASPILNGSSTGLGPVIDELRQNEGFKTAFKDEKWGEALKTGTATTNAALLQSLAIRFSADLAPDAVKAIIAAIQAEAGVSTLNVDFAAIDVGTKEGRAGIVKNVQDSLTTLQTTTDPVLEAYELQLATVKKELADSQATLKYYQNLDDADQKTLNDAELAVSAAEGRVIEVESQISGSGANEGVLAAAEDVANKYINAMYGITAAYERGDITQKQYEANVKRLGESFRTMLNSADPHDVDRVTLAINAMVDAIPENRLDDTQKEAIKGLKSLKDRYNAVTLAVTRSTQAMDLVNKMQSVQAAMANATGGELAFLVRRYEEYSQALADAAAKAPKLITPEVDPNLDPYGLDKETLTTRQNAQLKKIQEALSYLGLLEEDINKKYESRVNALDKVAELNREIAASQKDQLDIADALSRGDIAAAARAQQAMRANDAQRAFDQQRQALESAQTNEINNLKVKINGVWYTKEQLTAKESTLNRLSAKNAIKNNTSNISTVSPYAMGGSVKHYRPGGNVRGPGTGTSDDIPAMLSNGEYVIRAKAVKALGVDILDRMNHAEKFGIGGFARRFAKGGKVVPRNARMADRADRIRQGLLPGPFVDRSDKKKLSKFRLGEHKASLFYNVPNVKTNEGMTPDYFNYDGNYKEVSALPGAIYNSFTDSYEPTNAFREIGPGKYAFHSAQDAFVYYKVLMQNRRKLESFIKGPANDYREKDFISIEGAHNFTQQELIQNRTYGPWNGLDQKEAKTFAKSIKSLYGPAAFDSIWKSFGLDDSLLSDKPIRLDKEQKRIEKIVMDGHIYPTLSNNTSTRLHFADGGMVRPRSADAVERWNNKGYTRPKAAKKINPPNVLKGIPKGGAFGSEFFGSLNSTLSLISGGNPAFDEDYLYGTDNEDSLQKAFNKIRIVSNDIIEASGGSRENVKLRFEKDTPTGGYYDSESIVIDSNDKGSRPVSIMSHELGHNIDENILGESRMSFGEDLSTKSKYSNYYMESRAQILSGVMQRLAGIPKSINKGFIDNYNKNNNVWQSYDINNSETNPDSWSNGIAVHPNSDTNAVLEYIGYAHPKDALKYFGLSLPKKYQKYNLGGYKDVPTIKSYDNFFPHDPRHDPINYGKRLDWRTDPQLSNRRMMFADGGQVPDWFNPQGWIMDLFNAGYGDTSFSNMNKSVKPMVQDAAQSYVEGVSGSPYLGGLVGRNKVDPSGLDILALAGALPVGKIAKPVGSGIAKLIDPEGLGKVYLKNYVDRPLTLHNPGQDHARKGVDEFIKNNNLVIPAGSDIVRVTNEFDRKALSLIKPGQAFKSDQFFSITSGSSEDFISGMRRAEVQTGGRWSGGGQYPLIKYNVKSDVPGISDINNLFTDIEKPSNVVDGLLGRGIPMRLRKITTDDGGLMTYHIDLGGKTKANLGLNEIFRINEQADSSVNLAKAFKNGELSPERFNRYKGLHHIDEILNQFARNRNNEKISGMGGSLPLGSITKTYQRFLKDPTHFANGGMVSKIKPSYFNAGGLARGKDTIPAMLTPGEFVMTRSAVQNFGVDNLKSINAGDVSVAPSGSTSSSDSVYNYSINVNVSSMSDPNDIAKTVMTQIKRIDSQKVRGIYRG